MAKFETTKRTKVALCETIEYLHMHCGPAINQGCAAWLISRAADETLSLVDGIVSGGYDSSRFDDDSQLLDVLRRDLRKILDEYERAAEYGEAPWRD